ncbi:BON domain-containing protein [Undibacterium sp. Ren11W]|uniref:BON domain-containing protein n=1 Tax=Undibacterium sp. Ren11W TaxID=3413045 RepID=UPI003BF3053E
MNKHLRFVFFASVLSLTMLASGCNKEPKINTTTEIANVSDIDVTTNVKRTLLQDDLLKGSNITVETLKGDVRLIGELNSQAQIEQAIKIARAADGAHTIHDELTLKK